MSQSKTHYPDHYNYVLSGFHELRKKQRHVTKSDLAKHLGITPKKFVNWTNRSTINRVPVNNLLVFDGIVAIDSQRVIEYIRKHYGPDRTATVKEIVKNAHTRSEMLAKLQKNGYIRIAICESNKMLRHFISLKDYPQTVAPRPTRWIDTAKYRRNSKFHLPRRDTPALKKPMTETQEDRRDTETLEVYFAICQNYGRENWPGWSVAEIAEATGKPINRVKEIVDYIAQIEGSQALVEVARVNGAKRYKRKRIAHEEEAAAARRIMLRKMREKAAAASGQGETQ
jgi:hypothetical protein